MVAVQFIGPDAVEIDLRGVEFDDPRSRVVVKPGDVIEVSDEVANGREGVEVIGDDGEPVVNPDTKEPEVVGRYGGLLDQTDKWKPAAAKKTKTPAAPANQED